MQKRDRSPKDKVEWKKITWTKIRLVKNHIKLASFSPVWKLCKIPTSTAILHVLAVISLFRQVNFLEHYSAQESTYNENILCQLRRNKEGWMHAENNRIISLFTFKKFTRLVREKHQLLQLDGNK